MYFSIHFNSFSAFFPLNICIRICGAVDWGAAEGLKALLKDPRWGWSVRGYKLVTFRPSLTSVPPLPFTKYLACYLLSLLSTCADV